MVPTLARFVAGSLALVSTATAQVDVAWSDGFTPPSELGRFAFAVEPDGSGGSVVAMGAKEAAGWYPVWWEDLVVRRLDQNGDRSWDFTLPLTVQDYSGVTGRERFEQLAVGADGSVAIAVMAADAARVHALDPGGALRWTRRFRAAAAPHASIVSLEYLDGGDLIAVVAEYEAFISSSARRTSIVRLDGATGANVWRINIPANAIPVATTNALGETGLLMRVPLVGHVFELYDANGNRLDNTGFSFSPSDWIPHQLELHDTGRTIALHDDSGQWPEKTVTSIDAAGVIEWETTEDYLWQGDLLASGDYLYTISQPNEPLRRIRPDGTVVNSVLPPVVDGRFTGVQAAQVGGGFYAYGAFGPSGPSTGSFLARYDANEQLLWSIDPSPAGYEVSVVNGFAADDRGNIVVSTSQVGASNHYESVRTLKLIEGGDAGTPYCGPAVANSTGSPASIRAAGSDARTDDNVTLLASSLPGGTFVLFLASTTQGFAPGVGGGQGALCLGGSIGRYVAPGQIRRATQGGLASLQIDLDTVPQPTGLVSASAGQTWSFQAWYRDANPGTTSNLTDGVAVTLQ